MLAQLHVCPCPDGKSLYILRYGHLRTTSHKHGVAVCDVVVAVVDDTVVHVCRVVLVGCCSREVCKLAQVCLCVHVCLGEVTSHLVDEHVLVYCQLNTLQYGKSIEHGVGLLVECRVEDNLFRLGFQNVLTRSGCEEHSEYSC